MSGSQGHRVSLVQGEEGGKEQVVAIYMCFQQHSQFLLVRVTSQAGQFTLIPVTTVYNPDYDLVGFSASDRGLVGVWTSSEGDTVVRRTVVGGVGWDTVIDIKTVTTCDSDMLAPEELELNSEEDPRQVYLGALFSPGAFLASTLVKTVAIFRRSVEREEGVSWDRLRAEVVSAVECEVQGSLQEYEVTDEDYVLARRAAWARFYSCACQYRMLHPGTINTFSDAVARLHRPDLISKSIAQEVLADQE